MIVDIRTESTTASRFVCVREKVTTLVDYMSGLGKTPESVALFAGDYRALQNAINSRLRKEARAKEKAENEQRKANRIKEKVKVVPERVDGAALRPRPACLAQLQPSAKSGGIAMWSAHDRRRINRRKAPPIDVVIYTVLGMFFICSLIVSLLGMAGAFE